MSFKEHKKREEFMKTVESENHRLRLNNCMNKSHFWEVAKAFGYNH